MERPEQTFPEHNGIRAPRRPDCVRLFKDRADAITTVATSVARVAGPGAHWSSWAYVPKYPPEMRRIWHCTLQREHEVHKAVMLVLGDDWAPKDMDQLVLEWPAVSTDGRLAYTRDERAGKNGGPRTVTSVGRYLKRHWPHLPDHYIRDIDARTKSAAPIMWHTVKDIVRAVQEGPRSCMQWRADDGDPVNYDHHPYEVYDPKYGWRMCVRIVDGVIMARTLVLHHSRGPYTPGETLKGSISVRSYKRDPDGGYSYADEASDAWLSAQGVERADGWPAGARLAMLPPIRSWCRFLAPYLDGGNEYVDVVKDHLEIVEGSGYGYQCTNTDGTHDEMEDNRPSCADCDEYGDEDSGTYVGANRTTWVCSCCAESYVSALGFRGREYLVHEDQTVEVRDQTYHEDYLETNGIVRLETGEYEHEDYAFKCPVDGEWYCDSDGVETEDYPHQLVAESNTWTCERTGLVYSNDAPHRVDENGDWYFDGELEVKPKAVEVKPKAVEVELANSLGEVLTDAHGSRTGPPPGIGWWETTGPDPEPGSRRDAHGLFRYWDGTRWSTDVWGNATESARERNKGIVAVTPQDEIVHRRVRAPWDRPQPEITSAWVDEASTPVDPQYDDPADVPDDPPETRATHVVPQCSAHFGNLYLRVELGQWYARWGRATMPRDRWSAVSGNAYDGIRPLRLPPEAQFVPVDDYAQLTPLPVLADLSGPVPPSDRPVYQHPTSRDMGVFYRTGSTGQIDVWFPHRGASWAEGVGEPNRNLDSLECGYQLVWMPPAQTPPVPSEIGQIDRFQAIVNLPQPDTEEEPA